MALTEHITYIDPEDPREQPFRVYFADGKLAAAVDALRGKEGIEFDGNDRTSLEGLKKLLSRDNPQAPHALVVRSDTKLKTKRGPKDKGLPPDELETLLADSHLQLVIRAGIGVDNIDSDVAAKHGIVVENTPRANVNAVVTKTLRDIGYVFSEQFRANLDVKSGKVDKPKWTEHPDVYGNRIFGIVGLGNIGSRVALEIQKRGAKHVIGYDPYVQLEDVENVSLEELCRRSDVISVHAALTESSDDMIGAQQFRLMKDGVVIINNARGGIVNEITLLERLSSGQVYAAVLDVLTIEGRPLVDEDALKKLEPGQQEHVLKVLRPLISHPRTIVSMHGGANSAEAQEGNGKDTAAQLIDFAYGLGLYNTINFPPVNFSPYRLNAATSYRVLLLNENLPDVWKRVDGAVHGIHEGYNVETVVGLPSRDEKLAARVTEITFRRNKHIETVSLETAQRIIRAMRDVENVLGVRMVRVDRRTA